MKYLSVKYSMPEISGNQKNGKQPTEMKTTEKILEDFLTERS
ncbi:MAG: hypothetical protein ACLUVM_08600 [Blautia faecis]